jgi:hypothetical protein
MSETKPEKWVLPQCRYILPNGRRCRGIRLKNHPHSCYFHAPLSVRRAGKPSPLPFHRLDGTERELIVEARDRIKQRMAKREDVPTRDRIILAALHISLRCMDEPKAPRRKR